MRLEDELKMKAFSSEIQKAHLNIMFTAAWLKARVEQSLKDYDLTQEQYNVLRILRGQYPNAICLKDITCRMIYRNSNTTRIVNRLLAKELVVKNQSETDKREIKLSIHQKGLDILDKIDVQWKQNPVFASSISEEDMQKLNEILEKMRDIE
jgi:DNA-binding MarR family transcriptional regulator